MSVVRKTATLRNLREQPMWKLLAADRAPAIAALLDNLLLEQDKVLPSSVIEERLIRDLETLRANGYDFPFGAKAYLAEWLSLGWLTRRLAPGAVEEEFSLTSEAANAVRFLMGTIQPRRSATESRLATVISQLNRLAEETDGDRKSRLEYLLAERDRLDREIERVNSGEVRTLPDDRALERTRDIIFLAEELVSDFRQVRDEFEQLNRQLRERLMDYEGSRGHLLEKLFSGVDVIGESDAGRTFHAFWRLLNDNEQSAVLNDAIDAVSSRPFSRALLPAERRMLRNLTTMLLAEGSAVHDVQQTFARGLKHFVQSREFMENRRLHSLLRIAQRSALEAKEQLRTNANIGFSLTFTSARLSSAAQWGLFDPTTRVGDTTMELVPEGELSMQDISEMVRRSEIDLRSLKRNILSLFEDSEIVSLSDLLQRFDAEQGLGSVVGYISLATKHGQIINEHPFPIEWTGADGVRRSAQAPSVFFLRQNAHELES